MSVLSREKLLGATTPPQESVNVPELGGEVLVRGMTGVERDAFEATLIVGKGRKRDINTVNMRAKLVAYCCVDETGRRIFTDDDAVALGKVRADILDRIFSVAQRLSGVTDQDADDLGSPSKTPTPSGTLSSPSLVSSA